MADAIAPTAGQDLSDESELRAEIRALTRFDDESPNAWEPRQLVEMVTRLNRERPHSSLAARSRGLR